MLLFTPYIASSAEPFSPVLVSSVSTGSPGTPTTTHAITGIGSIPVGDLIVAVVAMARSGSGATSVSVDTGASGSNWTIRDQAVRTTTALLAIVTKTAEGSDALTLTSDVTSYGAIQVYRIPRGVYAGNGTAVANFSTGAVNPPAVTPAGGSDEYIVFAAESISGGVAVTSGPSGYSTPDTLQNVHSATGGKCSVAWLKLTTSSEDPGQFTNAASVNYVTQTFAVSEA